MTKTSAARTWLWAFYLVSLTGTVSGTQPPRPGQSWPASYRQWTQSNRQVLSTRAYVPLVNRIRANRDAVRRGVMTSAAAAQAGGTAVTGSRSIPVLLSKFSNTGADPYPNANLQRELFDGPWPTGTMTDYYKEISYNKFTVTGTVFPWKQLPQPDTFYEGPGGCNGICNNAKTADFLKNSLTANDASVNFAQFDNDGPDGAPNSGDDDGFVDFVAFVHAENGGECGGGNNNIWSHRFAISGWGTTPFTTNDAKNGGGFIQVDDYVVMPAVACDGSTMIQIGVFCHEFGHAFGLPDLYDTDNNNGDSEGLGNWCLMAGGSWGGDGASPERPAHMSAWAKIFLGWVAPEEVSAPLNPATIRRFEDNAVAFRIPISATQYYLVHNIQRVLFDARYPTAGLAVMKVNETVVNAGLANNSVNADENNQGVELMEADGRKDLDNSANRGDAGDLFPGSGNATRFDNSTNPASAGTTSICSISAAADPMTARLIPNSGSCNGGGGGGGGGGCGAMMTAGRGGGGPAGWFILMAPAFTAIAVLALRRRRAHSIAVAR